MPACLRASGSVRTSANIMSAKCAVRGPDLLPVDHEVVAVLARRASGAIARSLPGAGLGVALTPEHLAADRRPDPALLLLLAAVLEQRRHEHRRALAADPARHARARELLVDDHGLQACPARRRSRRTSSGSCARRSRSRSAASATRAGPDRVVLPGRPCRAARGPCSSRGTRAPPRGTSRTPLRSSGPCVPPQPQPSAGSRQEWIDPAPGTCRASVRMASSASPSLKLCVCIFSSGTRRDSISRIAAA